jgi:hypothetical protein
LNSRVLAVGTLLWLGLAPISLVWLGLWPRTLIAWLLVLMFGPALLVILEGVGELGGEVISRLPGIRHADGAIERRTRGKSVSGVRIGYYLARALILAVPFVLIVWWVVGKLSGTTPGAIRAWWEQNFY